MCDTRWLSFSNSVSNLHQIMDSVLSALNENINEGDKLAEVLYEQIDKPLYQQQSILLI